MKSKKKIPSETKRSAFYKKKIALSFAFMASPPYCRRYLWWGEGKLMDPRKEDSRSLSTWMKNNGEDFYDWLVGFTDGDGNFYFAKTKKDSWTFSFKITQSSYNLRALYHMKNIIGVGKVTISEPFATYRVRDYNHIREYILPIFEKYPLLTSKYFEYVKFKKAIEIQSNSTLSSAEKNWYLEKLKNQEKILRASPALENVGNQLKYKRKNWLVGFVEAEGSFYLTEKSKNRLVHGFEITKKSEEALLLKIADLFEMKFYKKRTHYTVVTSKKDSIEKVITFFHKTMKGMKSLEYRIWARSFKKKDQSFEKLSAIVHLLRSIRSIRFDKNFCKIRPESTLGPKGA